MTNKIIGIHKATRRNKDKKVLYNLGTFLKYPLSELNGNKNDNNSIYNKTEEQNNVLHHSESVDFETMQIIEEQIKYKFNLNIISFITFIFIVKFYLFIIYIYIYIISIYIILSFYI